MIKIELVLINQSTPEDAISLSKANTSAELNIANSKKQYLKILLEENIQPRINENVTFNLKVWIPELAFELEYPTAGDKKFENHCYEVFQNIQDEIYLICRKETSIHSGQIISLNDSLKIQRIVNNYICYYNGSRTDFTGLTEALQYSSKFINNNK